jgi:hypothetical protein
MKRRNALFLAGAVLLGLGACSREPEGGSAAPAAASSTDTSSSAPAGPAPAAEEPLVPTLATDYAIYAVLLRDPELMAPHAGLPNDHWAVVAETAPPLPAEIVNAPHSQRVHDFWGGARDDYLRRQQDVFTLEATRLSAEVPVKLVSRAELKSWNEGNAFWTDFWRAHPGGGGLYTLSRVGYGKDGRHAFACFDRSAGLEDGTTWSVYLELKDGAWVIAHKQGEQSR